MGQLSIGESLQLREGDVVKIFVPYVTTQSSGTATVRVGDEYLTIDASTNGVPLAPNSERFHIPPSYAPTLSAVSSDVSLIGQPGGDRDVDKVLVFNPTAQDPAGWLNEVCVGDSPIAFNSSESDRYFYAFIVDHGLLEDNTGAVYLELDLGDPVATQNASWSQIRERFDD